MSCYMSPELLELISLHVDVPDGIAYVSLPIMALSSSTEDEAAYNMSC